VDPPKQSKLTMTMVGDEGTSSPFIARLFAGIIEIRERALPPENHDSFDKAFIALRTGLDSVRESAALIRNAVKDHRAKLASKKIVKLHGMAIEITESIDRLLSKEIEDFLNTAYRVLKDREQLLLKQLGIDI